MKSFIFFIFLAFCQMHPVQVYSSDLDGREDYIQSSSHAQVPPQEISKDEDAQEDGDHFSAILLVFFVAFFSWETK